MTVPRSTQKYSGHGEKRSRLKERAIVALLQNGTVKEAAEEIGVHERTLGRWLREPAFTEDYRTAREGTLQFAQERLRLGTVTAVYVLLSIAQDRKAPSAARVTAARTVLESTGILKGQTVTVNNNQVVPATVEGIDQAMQDSLREPGTRAWLKSLLQKIESEESRHTLAN